MQVYVFWESCYTAPQYTPFDLLILSRMWPHLNEIMFRYISNSFISIKLKLTWQLSFLHVKKCLSYLHILLFYALTYYICKILSYHFFAWIQAFASMINVNAACKADYSHLCASIIAELELKMRTLGYLFLFNYNSKFTPRPPWWGKNILIFSLFREVPITIYREQSYFAFTFAITDRNQLDSVAR